MDWLAFCFSNQLLGLIPLTKKQNFDLITACDCIHDLTDPTGVLTALKGLLHPTGTLFVVEPKVADRLEDNINSIGSLYYGMSVLHCMTQSLASGGPGLGTCMGPARLEALVKNVGFTRFEVLEIKSLTTLFYSISHWVLWQDYRSIAQTKFVVFVWQIGAKFVLF